jgi:sugar/nucleoside kinase (ribokinase family)
VAGVFDWSLNPLGTELAEGLFRHCTGRGILTYLDTSDPAPRRDEIPGLFQRVLSLSSLSHLNLNENELKQFTGAQSGGDSSQELIALARELLGRISACLTVHTERYSLSLDPEVSLMPTFQARPLRTTGAGDSWNGGNILGLLLGLPPMERLLLANAVAAYYIESPTASRPDPEQLIRFLQTRCSGTSEFPT